MGASIHCFLVFLLTVPFLTVEAHNCAQGWQEYNNNCYAYFDKKVTWSTAEARCQEYKGHLVSILIPEEVTMVSNLMAAYYNEDNNVWIGLHVFHKPNGSSKFRWSDGSPYYFTSWENNAPHPAKPRKDCVGVTCNSAFSQWTNMHCSTKKAYICKYSF